MYNLGDHHEFNDIFFKNNWALKLGLSITKVLEKIFKFLFLFLFLIRFNWMRHLEKCLTEEGKVEGKRKKNQVGGKDLKKMNLQATLGQIENF